MSELEKTKEEVMKNIGSNLIYMSIVNPLEDKTRESIIEETEKNMKDLNICLENLDKVLNNYIAVKKGIFHGDRINEDYYRGCIECIHTN